jgi:hypothetical protein
VQSCDPLRALYKLRRRIPTPIRPSRGRMYRLCWEAVYVQDQHGIWVSRTIDCSSPSDGSASAQASVTLQIAIRICG